jgi:hypothetical protein
MNTLPEWFTVDVERTYRVELPGLAGQRYGGAQLRDGLEVDVQPGVARQLLVSIAPS